MHRRRKLLWRKLNKLKFKMERTTSVHKLVKFLQDRQDLELELKSIYKDLNQQSEAKVLAEMKTNPKVFFSFAKARQKTKAKVGPFLDPNSGGLSLSFT